MAQYSGSFTLQQQMQAQAASNWPAAPDPTLVLFLDSGNTASYPGSGTTWTDLSIYGNNATLNGGIGYSSSNSGYLTLNGSSQYASTATTSNLNLSSNNFTIETWAYISTAVTSGNQYYTFSAIGTSTSDSSTMFTGIWRSGLYPGCIYNSFNNTNAFGTANRPDIGYAGATYNLSGAWHQLVFTSSGGSGVFYIDGAQWATNSVSAPPSSSNTFCFGGATDGNLTTPGYISIARIYTRALTSSQVTANFNQFRSRYGI